VQAGRADLRLEPRGLLAIADDLAAEIEPLVAQDPGGGDQRVEALLLAQPPDREDPRQKVGGLAQTRVEALQIDAVIFASEEDRFSSPRNCSSVRL
jgi:hypothetical protein